MSKTTTNKSATKSPKTPKTVKTPKTQKAKKVKGTKRNRNETTVVFPAPPKNTRNAYTFFFKEQRKGVNDENPGAAFGEITAKVADMWNNLQDAQKESYEKEAAKDAKRYETERSDWDKKVRELGSEPEDVIRNLREAKKRRKNRVKKPKGARNPYVLFSMDKREELKDEGLEFDDMTRRLGQEWKKVSAKDRKKYEKAAAKDKVRHEEEMKKFREEHPEQDSSKKAKRVKKPGEPKGARNAYIFYNEDERSKVKADHPDMAPTDVMRELGKRWNTLDSKGKSKYEELAANDKKRHDKEMKKWTASQTSA